MEEDFEISKNPEEIAEQIFDILGSNIEKVKLYSWSEIN